MILRASPSRYRSVLVQWVAPALTLALIGWLTTFAPYQQKTAALAETSKGSTSSEEDAESFLPNPQLLQGQSLAVYAVAFSPDGKSLALAAGRHNQSSGETRLWDLEKGQLVTSVKAAHPVRSLAFSPDSKFLAIAAFDDAVNLWDPSTLSVRDSRKGHTRVNCVTFSADGKRGTVAGLDKLVSIGDVDTRKQQQRLEGHADEVL